VVSPNKRHQRIVLRLTMSLGNFLEAHPEHGELLIAPFDIVLPKPQRRVIQPDLFVLTKETLTRMVHLGL
jgi:hypothetical protein